MADDSIPTRTKSQRELIIEATSAQHLASHYPHNPYCELCALGHLKHQQYAHEREAKDAGLKPLTGKLQLISTDAMVVARSHTDATRLGADGETVTLTVLDHWSGFNYGFPTGTSSTDRYRYCLKFFVGPGWTKLYLRTAR